MDRQVNFDTPKNERTLLRNTNFNTGTLLRKIQSDPSIEVTDDNPRNAYELRVIKADLQATEKSLREVVAENVQLKYELKHLKESPQTLETTPSSQLSGLQKVLQAGLREAEEENDKLKANLEKETQKTAEKSAKIRDLVAALEKSQLDVRKTEENLKKLKQKNDSITIQQRSQQLATQALEDQIAELGPANKMLKSQMDDLEVQNEKLRKDLDEIKGSQTTLETEKRDLLQKNLSLDRDNLSAQETLKKQALALDRLKLQSKRQETDLALKQAEIDQLIQDAKDVQAHLSKESANSLILNKRNGVLENRVEELDKSNKKLQAEKAKLKKDQASGKIELNKTQKECSEQKALIGNLKDQVQRLKSEKLSETSRSMKELSDLRLQLEKETTATLELKRDSDSKQVEITTLNSKIQSLEKKHKRGEHTLQESQAKVKKLERQINQLDSEKQGLMAKLSDQEQKLGESVATVQKLKCDAKAMEDVLKKERIKSRDREAENKILTTSRDSMRASQIEAQGQKKTLLSQVAQLQKELSGSGDKLAVVKIKLAHAKDEIRGRGEQIDMLQTHLKQSAAATLEAKTLICQLQQNIKSFLEKALHHLEDSGTIEPVSKAEQHLDLEDLCDTLESACKTDTLHKFFEKCHDFIIGKAVCYNQDLKAKARILEEKIDSAEDRNSELCRDIANLLAKLQQNTELIKGKNKLIENLECSAKNSGESQLKLQRENTELQLSVANLSNEITSLQKAVQTKNSQIKLNNQNTQLLKDTLKTKDGELSEQYLQLRDISSKNHESQRQLDVKDGKISELKATLQELFDANQKLVDKLTDANGKLVEHRSSLAIGNEELARKNSLLQELKIHSGQLEKKSSSLSLKLDALNQEKEGQKVEHAAMLRKLTDLQQQLFSVTEQKQTIDGKLNEKVEELQEAKDQFHALQKSYDKQNRSIQDLEKTLSEKIKEHSNVNAAYYKEKEIIKDLSGKLQKSREQLKVIFPLLSFCFAQQRYFHLSQGFSAFQKNAAEVQVQKEKNMCYNSLDLLERSINDDADNAFDESGQPIKSEASALKQKISQKLSQLQNSLQDKDKRLRTLQQSNKELTTHLSASKSSFASLKDGMAHEEATKNTLQQKVQKQQEQISVLTESLENMKHEQHETYTELDVSTKQNESNKKTILDLQQQVINLREKEHKLSKEYQDAETHFALQVQTKMNEITSLTRQLRDAQNTGESLDNEILKHKEAYALIQGQFNSKCKEVARFLKIENDFNEKCNENDKLRTDLETKIEENTELLKCISEFQDKYKKFEELQETVNNQGLENSKLLQFISELQQRVLVLSTNVNDFEERENLSQTEIEALAQENSGLKNLSQAQIHALTQENSKLKNEIDFQKSTVANLDSQKSKTEALLKELNDLHNSLSKDGIDKQAELEKHKQRLGSLQDNLKLKDSQLCQLRLHIDQIDQERENQVAELSSTVDSLRGQVKACQELNAMFKKHTSELENDLHQATDEKDALVKTVQDQQDKLQAFEEMQVQQNKLSEQSFSEQLQSKARENKHLQKRLMEFQKENADQKKELSSLEDQLHTKLLEIEDQKKEILSLEDQLQQKLSESHKSHQDQQNELSILEEQMSKVLQDQLAKENEVKALQTSFNEVEAELAREKANASDMVQAKTEELLNISEGSKKLLEQTVQRLCAETSDKARLQQLVQSVEEKHREAQSKVAELDEMVIELQNKINKLQADAVVSEVNLSELKESFNSKRSEAEDLGAQKCKLQEEKQEMSTDLQNLTEESKTLRAENEMMRQQVEKMTRAMADQDEQLSLLGEDLEVNQDTQTRLKKEVADLLDKISFQTEEIAVVQACSHAKDAENKELSEQLSGLKKDLSKLEADRDLLQKQIEHAQTKAGNEKAEKESLQLACTELKRKKDKAEEDLIEAKGQLDMRAHSYDRMAEISQSQNERIIDAEKTLEKAEKELKKNQQNNWELQGLLEEKEQALKTLHSMSAKMKKDFLNQDTKHKADILSLKEKNEILMKRLSDMEQSMLKEAEALSLSKESTEALKNKFQSAEKQQQCLDFFVKLLKQNLSQVQVQLKEKDKESVESSHELQRLNTLLKEKEESLRLCHESIAQLYSLLDEKDHSLNVLETSLRQNGTQTGLWPSHSDDWHGVSRSKPRVNIVPARSPNSEVIPWDRSPNHDRNAFPVPDASSRSYLSPSSSFKSQSVRDDQAELNSLSDIPSVSQLSERQPDKNMFSSPSFTFSPRNGNKDSKVPQSAQGFSDNIKSLLNGS